MEDRRNFESNKLEEEEKEQPPTNEIKTKKGSGGRVSRNLVHLVGPFSSGSSISFILDKKEKNNNSSNSSSMEHQSNFESNKLYLQCQAKQGGGVEGVSTGTLFTW